MSAGRGGRVGPCHRMPGWLLGGLFAVVLGGPLPVRAQRALQVDSFSPALDDYGFLGLDGTRTPGDGQVTVALFSSFATELLVAQPLEGEARVLVRRRLAGHLGAHVGLGRWLGLGLQLPVTLHQVGQRLLVGDRSLSKRSGGDPRLSLRYRLWGDPADRRTQHKDGPGVALQLTGVLPAGDTDSYSGEGTPRTELSLLADFQVLGWGVGLAVGWAHRFEPRDVLGVRFADALTFGVGVKVPLPSHPALSGVLELRGRTDFRSEAATPVEGDFALRYALDDWALTAAVGTGLSRGVGAPQARAVLGLWWAPRPADADGDGVEDGADACPPLPEDLDGFQDEDGCPDPDNDNDLVPDVDDLCPNEEALEGQDDDEDGCTDR